MQGLKKGKGAGQEETDATLLPPPLLSPLLQLLSPLTLLLSPLLQLLYPLTLLLSPLLQLLSPLTLLLSPLLQHIVCLNNELTFQRLC